MERGKQNVSQEHAKRFKLLKEFIKFPKYDNKFYNREEFIAMSMSQMKQEVKVVCLLGE